MQSADRATFDTARCKGNLLFTLAAAVLVFFNHLYFLKWYPVLESRVWVVILLFMSFPAAISTTYPAKPSLPAALFLVILQITVCVNYLSFQQYYFDYLYLVGFFISTLPFFALGVLSSARRDIVQLVMFTTGVAFVLILSWVFAQGRPLYDELGFSDILKIGRFEGDQSYRSHYQLIGYGLAFGEVALVAFFLHKNRIYSALAILAGSLVLGLSIGARGPLLALILTFFAVLTLRSGLGRVTSIILLFFALSVSGVIALDYSDTALYKRFAADINVGLGNEQATQASVDQSRITLYSAAIKGWLSSPVTFLFGNGFGSFSVGYGYEYPTWLFGEPTKSFYPHNFMLEALYELGVVGFIPLILALLSPLRRFLRSQSPSLDAAGVNVLGFLLFMEISALLSGSFAMNYMLYFALGLAAGYDPRQDLANKT